MNADGTDLTRLTHDDTDIVDFEPAWSPDGSKIAFRRGPDIYLMNPDGTGLVNWSNYGSTTNGGPSWSPDGTQIAFGSRRVGNWEIYVMNADGTGLTRLTDDPASDFLPAWSPDGSKIAFMTDRDGNEEIYVMNPDGTGLVNLTNSPSREYSPAWSPGG
jgi:Tol biopolymer transport system component